SVDVLDYLNTNLLQQDDDLDALKAQTDKMPEKKMQITKEQGAFLTFLIQSFNIKNILEIGVYTGTSTLYMAKAIKDGHITAIDRNKEWTKIAQKFWKQAQVEDKISLHIGDAKNILKNLKDETFDLVFIDADKKNHPLYFEESLRLLKPKGFILLDNIFLNGTIIKDPSAELSKTMTGFYKALKDDSRINQTFLPFYDGMILVFKK
ncbi:MAG: O-methyltransferase, partial [Proteobacteria bacterium]|nr:O-methyltransferase [Pseudomonadota bacterium]